MVGVFWNNDATVFGRVLTAKGVVTHVAAWAPLSTTTAVLRGQGASVLMETVTPKAAAIQLLDGLSLRPMGLLQPHAACLITEAKLPASALITGDDLLPAALREEETRQTATVTQLWNTAASCLAAAKRLTCHRITAQQASLSAPRICRYAAHLYLSERMITQTPRHTHHRAVLPCFFSAVTPKGHTVFTEALRAFCPRLYVIEDAVGAVSALMLRELYRRFSTVTCCVVGDCPVTGRIDHLVLPDLGVGFTHSNTWHTVDFPVYRRIYASRFYSSETTEKRYAAREQNAVYEHLNRAVHLLAKAEKIEKRQHIALRNTLANTPRFTETLSPLLSLWQAP